MTKKRYYTICKKGRYGMDAPLFRFENLDGSIEMFKHLMTGKAIDLDHRGIPDKTKTPDKDGWVSSEYFWVEEGEPEYHLGSEIIDVYTQEELKSIEQERDEWLAPFKEKAKKEKK